MKDKIPAIRGRCSKPREFEIHSPFPIRLDSSTSFSTGEYPELRGRILAESGQMIQGLLGDKTLTLFASCTIEKETSSRKSLRRLTQSSCVLDATIYGPIELFEQIGVWFQDQDLYLQDPILCHMDVKYCNPHRLSSEKLESLSLVSEVVSQSSSLVYLQDISRRPDLLDILSCHDNLPEARQPALIKSELKRYSWALSQV